VIISKVNLYLAYDEMTKFFAINTPGRG